MSRSEKRTRGRRIPLTRVNDEEFAVFEEKAKPFGSFGALIRSTVMGYRAPRSKVDQELAVKFLAAAAPLSALAREIKAESGKQGSNLNQIAYMLNAGRPPERLMGMIEEAVRNTIRTQEAADEVMRDFLEMRTVLMQALGKEPNRDGPE